MKNLIFFFAFLIGLMGFAPVAATAAGTYSVSPAASTTTTPAPKKAKKVSLLQKLKKAVEDNAVLLIILAIFIPPLAVYLKEGRAGMNFWLTFLLWLLFVLPGIIYALIVVLRD
jgi:uncharacterized membrane protein YqaE (UPF0057 family)